MSQTKTLTRTALAAALFASTALAAHAEDLRAHFALHTVELDDAGAEQLVERETVKPGETLHFSINHENLAEEALGDLVIVGPVPEGVTLKLGTQESSLDAYFEIQADMDPEQPGLEWSALPAMRKIVEDDGTVRMEPVPEDIIEAVRWTLDAPLAVGERALNSYRVVVN